MPAPTDLIRAAFAISSLPANLVHIIFLNGAYRITFMEHVKISGELGTEPVEMLMPRASVTLPVDTFAEFLRVAEANRVRVESTLGALPTKGTTVQ